MTSGMTGNVRGATLADMLLFLATVGLATSLLLPAWSGRGFRERVETAIADVETLGSAARSTRDFDGRWPSPAAPGEAPRELAGLATNGGIFTRPDYTLEWTSWEVVDSVEAAPDAGPASADAPPDNVGPLLEPIVRLVGGIAVHAPDDALLAELLEHYADEISFVLDTTWLLILPERADAPAGGR